MIFKHTFQSTGMFRAAASSSLANAFCKSIALINLLLLCLAPVSGSAQSNNPACAQLNALKSNPMVSNSDRRDAANKYNRLNCQRLFKELATSPPPPTPQSLPNNCSHLQDMISDPMVSNSDRRDAANKYDCMKCQRRSITRPEDPSSPPSLPNNCTKLQVMKSNPMVSSSDRRDAANKYDCMKCPRHSITPLIDPLLKPFSIQDWHKLAIYKSNPSYSKRFRDSLTREYNTKNCEELIKAQTKTKSTVIMSPE